MAMVRLKILRLLVRIFYYYPGQNGNVSLPCQQVLDDILSRIQHGQVERVIIILYTHPSKLLNSGLERESHYSH